MREKIEKLKKEYDKITKELAKPQVISNPQKLASLSKRNAQITKILQKYNDYQKLQKEINSTQKLLKEPEIAQEAGKELKELEEEKTKIRKELEADLKPKKLIDSKDIIMEIRAGAGGEEAALFAANLFRMYSRYVEKKGWQINLLNSSRTGLGGFKEIIFEVNGENVYETLKYESGVHRVQRIPETEKGGRIHTSTASVAVLPQAEDRDIKIKEDDLRIDVYRSSGPGGQSVNTTDSAVRITHLPTGLVVSCQDQKSQLKNREKAMQILKSRLLEKKREEETRERGKERLSQIGKAQRAEKIRTYNFPQDRITDHRIKKSWYGMERILDGELEEIIQTVRKNIER